MLTIDGLYFGKVGSDKLIDVVPLCEIVSIEPMSDRQQKVKEDRHRRQRRSSSKAIGLTSAPSMESFRIRPQSGTIAEAEAGEDDSETAKDDKELTFTVQPCPDGHNSGRAAILKAKSPDELHIWVDLIAEQVSAAKLAARAGQTKLQLWRDWTRVFYQSDRTQYSIGLVILGSYLMAIANAQMLPWMTG